MTFLCVPKMMCVIFSFLLLFFFFKYYWSQVIKTNGGRGRYCKILFCCVHVHFSACKQSVFSCKIRKNRDATLRHFIVHLSVFFPSCQIVFFSLCFFWSFSSSVALSQNNFKDVTFACVMFWVLLKFIKLFNFNSGVVCYWMKFCLFFLSCTLRIINGLLFISRAWVSFQHNCFNFQRRRRPF